MKRNHLPHTEQGSQQLCLARPPSGAKSPRVLQTAGGHGRSPASRHTDTHSLRSRSFACRVCLIYQDTKNSSPSEQLGATVTTWFLTEMHLPKCRLLYHDIENRHLPEQTWTRGAHNVACTHCWVWCSLASGSYSFQLHSAPERHTIPPQQ